MENIFSGEISEEMIKKRLCIVCLKKYFLKRRVIRLLLRRFNECWMCEWWESPPIVSFKTKKRLSPHYGNNQSGWTRTLSGPWLLLLLLLLSQTAALYLNQSIHKTPRPLNHREHFQLAQSHRWGNSTGTPDKQRDSTSFMRREKSRSARAETRQRAVLCVILAFGSEHAGLERGTENNTYEGTGAWALLLWKTFSFTGSQREILYFL